MDPPAGRWCVSCRGLLTHPCACGAHDSLPRVTGFDDTPIDLCLRLHNCKKVFSMFMLKLNY